MNTIQINASPRTELGKKATKALRNEGKIPAVLYSKNGVEHFSTTKKDVKGLVYTPEFKLAEVSLNGAARKAILKDIVFHPVTDAIMHIDLLELVDGHALKASVPVKFKGVSPGVKNGGKLMQTLRTVKIKTTPENLIDILYVDISELELGFAVRVRDMEVPEGVEVLVDGAAPIANVIVPRAMKSEAANAEDGADAEAETVEEGAEA
ncbi:UNVERIFIED_CONTAM: hypothetical protein GTU68_016414 [Idotea baltica]|nr:hypothetical protein [Idotea baltica]